MLDVKLRNALKQPVILIGGLPRSGTTLCERLFGSHPEIRIFDESPLSSMPSLLAEQQAFYGPAIESWRNLTECELKWRQATLIAELWMLGSDPKKLTNDRFLYVGQKTPGVEEDLPFYQRYFPCGLILIYCVRHPVRVLRSMLAMPWNTGVPAAQLIDYILTR